MLKIFTIFLILFNTVSAKEIKLVASHWPPFAIQTNNKAEGISVDILREIFEKKGYKLNIKFRPWTRVLKSVKEHKADIGFPAYYSKEREKFFLFSLGFFSSPLSIWKHKSLKIKSTKEEDLIGHTIGVVRGYINTPEIDNSKKLKRAAVNSDKQNIFKLIKKRISLAVIDDYVARYIIQNQLPEKEQQNLVPMRPALAHHSFHLLLPKRRRSKKLLEIFEKGLKQMKEDGSYQKIISKYKRSLKIQR